MWGFIFMRKNEALEAAIDECRKAGKSYTLKLCKRSTHYKMFIEGVKRVLIISNTFAIEIVRHDVRKAIKGS
jgi:hypothetical protein